MKVIHIKQAVIYGFGKWVDHTVTFSADTLNCFYGHNESGKTTLQQFILFMLFGFPPKKRQLYRPKSSGKMGGRLIISDPRYGTYTIERFDDVKNGTALCYLSSGDIKDEVWLREALHGIRAASYEAVYLFSALDLHQIKAMKHMDLGNVLLGIGLAGAHNVYDIEKQLDQEMGHLFKPFGTKPVINQQLDTLEKTHAGLIESKKRQATYHEQVVTVDQLEKDRQHLQTTIKQAYETYEHVQKQREHFSLIRDYHQLQQQYTTMPEKPTFPENGVERLEKINEQLLPLQSEYAVLTQHLQRNRTKHEQLKEAQLQPELLQVLEKMAAQLDDYNEARKTYHKLSQEQDTCTATLKANIAHLNVKLDIKALANITLPFYTEQNWQEIENETKQIAYERAQFAEQATENKQQKQALLATNKEIKAKLLTEARVDEVKQTVHTHKAMELETKMRQQAEKRQRQWQEQKKNSQKFQQTILISALLCGVLSGGLGWLFRIPALYIIMIGIGIIGASLWGMERRRIGETTRWLEDQVLPPMPGHVSEGKKAEAASLLRAHEENVQELRAVETQLKNHQIQELQWSEKNKMIEQRVARLQQRTQVEIETYPFLQQIDPVHWPAFYHALKNILKLESDRQDIRRQMADVQTHCILFETRLNDVLKRVDPELQGYETTSQIKTLQGLMTTHHDQTQQLLRINQERVEHIEAQTVVKQKMAVYEQEKNKLFDIADVENDDAFHNKAKAKADIEHIEEAIQNVTFQLQTLLPASLYERVLTERPNESDLNTLYETMKQQIETEEKALEMKRQQLADAKAQLNQLESSDAYSQLNHRFKQEKEAIQQLATKWSVQQVAKEMLAEAKQVYQAKYLAETIEKTSHYFKHVTNEKYIAIYAPTEKEPFQVTAKDHTRYQINELSQGTIDQLYVCLRLAIGEVMQVEHHLPFIIDDAFVHSDAQRTTRMIDVLKQISTRRQVILFTCKQEIIERLAANDVHILDEGSRAFG